MTDAAVAQTLFWIAFGVTAYVYLGYPALLAAWARVAPRPVTSASATPGISIVIAARNEAASLPARIGNLLASDYPRERMQIVVVSDGSTDATREVLERWRDDVEAVFVPAGGKARALNAGVAAARHEIVVFADARQTFAADALRALVAPFADRRVGGTTGELLLDCEAGAGESTIGEGLGAYWRYEKWLRRRESAIGSTLGATGAIYALRRSLWRPLPPDTILDDVLAPMRAVLSGTRVVFVAAARAFDKAAAAGDREFQRKTRTLAGNYQILRLEPRLLLPGVNPVWVQYVSHKLGRLLVPYALVAMLLSSAWLAPGSVFFAVVLAAQLGFYGLAAYGAVLDRRGGRERTRPGRAPDAVPELRPQ